MEHRRVGPFVSHTFGEDLACGPIGRKFGRDVYRHIVGFIGAANAIADFSGCPPVVFHVVR